MNELHFAIVTGINRYPGIDTQLESARHDAERFHEWLTDPAGGAIPADQIKCLVATDKEEESFSSVYDARPLYHELAKQVDIFHDQVRAKIGPRTGDWNQTRLYIYVAGHGIAPPAGRGALLFANARPDNLGEYLDLGTYDAYYEGQYLFREVLLLADCCREFSGSRRPAPLPSFGEFGPPPYPPRRYVGYAAAIGDKAWEPIEPDPDNSNGRGFFTRALLEGLRGKAASPETGNVEMSRLGAYIRSRVTELAGKLGYKQFANIVGAVGDPTVICTLPIVRHPVEITFMQGSLPPAALKRGDTTVEEWPGGPGPWRTSLPDGIYGIFVLDDGSRPLDNGAFIVHGAAKSVFL